MPVFYLRKSPLLCLGLPLAAIALLWHTDTTAAETQKSLLSREQESVETDIVSETQAQWEESQRILRARETYRILATRFNRELSGYYPFGPSSAPDTYHRNVCDFFKDYSGTLGSLKTQLEASGEQWLKIRFIADLESVGFFLSENVCSRFNFPIRIHFRPEDNFPVVGSPPRVWVLTDDFGEAHVPHGMTFLDWRFGRPIALETTWAKHTGVRPRESQGGDKFKNLDSATVRFEARGNWALMRFLDAYARRSSNFNADRTEVEMEFSVPLVKRPADSISQVNSKKVPTTLRTDSSNRPQNAGTSRFTVRLTFEDYGIGKPREALKWPKVFPQYAPGVD